MPRVTGGEEGAGTRNFAFLRNLFGLIMFSQLDQLQQLFICFFFKCRSDRGRKLPRDG